MTNSMILDRLFTAFVDEVVARLNQQTGISQTLASLSERVQKLEQDDLEGHDALTRRITDIVNNVVENVDVSETRQERIKEIVSDQLEDYNPTEAYGFDREIERIIGEMDLAEMIKRVIREEIEFEVNVS